MEISLLLVPPDEDQGIAESIGSKYSKFELTINGQKYLVFYAVKGNDFVPLEGAAFIPVADLSTEQICFNGVYEFTEFSKLGKCIQINDTFFLTPLSLKEAAVIKYLDDSGLIKKYKSKLVLIEKEDEDFEEIEGIEFEAKSTPKFAFFSDEEYYDQGKESGKFTELLLDFDFQYVADISFSDQVKENEEEGTYIIGKECIWFKEEPKTEGIKCKKSYVLNFRNAKKAKRKQFNDFEAPITYRSAKVTRVYYNDHETLYKKIKSLEFHVMYNIPASYSMKELEELYPTSSLIFYDDCLKYFKNEIRTACLIYYLNEKNASDFKIHNDELYDGGIIGYCRPKSIYYISKGSRESYEFLFDEETSKLSIKEKEEYILNCFKRETDDKEVLPTHIIYDGDKAYLNYYKNEVRDKAIPIIDKYNMATFILATLKLPRETKVPGAIRVEVPETYNAEVLIATFRNEKEGYDCIKKMDPSYFCFGKKVFKSFHIYNDAMSSICEELGIKRSNYINRKNLRKITEMRGRYIVFRCFNYHLDKFNYHVMSDDKTNQKITAILGAKQKDDNSEF